MRGRSFTLHGSFGIGLGKDAAQFLHQLLAIYLFLPLSVISPTSSGLGMISAFLISFFFYKEKYSPRQLIGVLLGASAVVLLAL